MLGAMGAYMDEFQSTLLMRGATALQDRLRQLALISIHAPHARSDFKVMHGLGDV